MIPTRRDGPWWFDIANNAHYWNGKFNLEFMVEHDIETTELIELAFVRHHPRFCSIDHQNCLEMRLHGQEVVGRFFTRLAASNSKLPPSVKPFTYRWDACADFAERQISPEVGDFIGNLESGDPCAPAIARAFLNAYVNPALQDDIPCLASFFRDLSALKDCCRSLIRAVMPK